MQMTSRLTAFVLLFMMTSWVSFATSDKKSDQEHGGQVDTEEEIDAYIEHHIDDSHYFTFFSDGETGKHFGFPLPVIIYDKENGLHVFSASKFHHGEELVEINGQHYKLYHSKIYKTDAEGTITYDEKGFVENEKPLDFSITKNLIGMILASALLLWMFTSLAKSYQKNQIPKGIGRFLEPLVIYVRDDIAKPNIGPKYKKYMSFLLTVFFFIWLLNLLGMTPFGFNVTGNIAVTFALALVTFIIVQFSGNKNYWKHIFWMPGVPVPMKIILIPIEILGMFTKPFALMIRLFANMTAGHVVIMSLLGLIVIMQNWIAGPVFFGFTIMISVIELLVAFLQAYIFTLLSALYIGMAVEEHDNHSEDVPVV
ncbi:F0F1 ATP synthase subunit A [Flavobacterium sp. CS20]|uniref:F0F1 ATP synthase subunit A n=1 Tax=Flavobacterium sp. CS20 TaxID=2775246 RepID=UPI001FFC7A67|nr:F0F1 ATP synthase subunit A [Flavobacterium sp. CS20]